MRKVGKQLVGSGMDLCLVVFYVRVTRRRCYRMRVPERLEKMGEG